MTVGWRKAIAILEVIGGLSGPGGIAFELARGGFPRAALIPAAVLTAVFLLSLFAGIMLWRDTRTGRVASVVAQLFQLPKIVSDQFAFMVSFGFDFFPMLVSQPVGNGVVWKGATFNVRGPSHLLLVNTPGLGEGFGVSVVSCVALYLLLKSLDPPPPPAPEPAADGVGEAVPKPEHPAHVYWRPSFGLLLVLAAVVLVLGLCGSCLLGVALMQPPRLGN